MKIAVLGTGMVGRALASALAVLGHDVTIGTRDVAATLARTEPDRMGNPPLADWARDHQGIAVAIYADAASRADLVVNATNGAGSLEALRAAGADNLAGKVLVDVSNPLDFSHGFPPSLLVCNTDSLGEQIQRQFPQTRVVKTLNTMNAALQANPRLVADGDHTTFLSGDDADAKSTVADLLTALGHKDVLDVGDITTARGTEQLLPLWVRLMGVVGTPMFQFKVVR